ncbi:MAG: ATP phosphoribosyltransferase regulatory subunit [Methylococcales symbiont of Iophon sp. n. MRB-2018]|nr:MAG: ATP phosphoribosyltransferase regulatory subunit [Methylococcales symbiont of Iophon sp. n. MRB-2018]KAF3979518.1 MAG: ATP phosphoribosyltransferase regulatory subunit [Methylococcales symbiont of Iophon sp. n. MRB-2018]
MKKNTWLLPQGIEEVLPVEAKQLELLRRQLLDVFACWGYELVIPPFVDFLDSLLVGSGHDLDLQTFKLTDQVSGEMLGIRADMTPQVARIDSHNLKHERPTRLCYVGTTLRTLSNSIENTRSPMQIGAEIYGHSGIESDVEVIKLMLEMLAITGLQKVHLDLGHVGIYRGLSQQAGLSQQQETELFEVLQRKAKTDLDELLDSFNIEQKFKTLFITLSALNGGSDVLVKAKEILADTNETVTMALTELQAISDLLRVRFSALTISFDLSELRGYNYHTGIVFAAFVAEVGREIARGGRYDNIGEFFGRARPATGFSADLRLLSSLAESIEETTKRIYAPHINDSDLNAMVRELRAKGVTVIQQLPGHQQECDELQCTEILEKENQKWIVRSIA